MSQHATMLTLPPRCTLLRCEQNHEHLVGDKQVKRIILEPCCWCHTPLHVALWWQDGKVVGAP